MTKKGILSLLMCLAVMGTAWAESISEYQARNIAAKFMARHAIQSQDMKLAGKASLHGTATSNDQAAYYVFNAEHGGGYIIIAGDDRSPAVLGYSDKGTFDPANVPEAMQQMLDGYAAQITSLAHGAQAATILASGKAISPMVKAVWSQNNPYNILFPYLSAGKHAYVGCVATAMAQLLHYWQWPVATTQPIPGYTTETLGINMPELPVTQFDWANMQDTYQTTDTSSVAALAASQLSLYCAQAVEMNFKSSSSGATSARIPIRLATYFDYDAGAHMESRYNYSTQGWADLIYNELQAGRPVIYSGSKASGGHAFICDGYDGNGMFHINWGWNGQSNGYFLLNVLNPDEQGTGSADGAYGYIYSQGVLVGIQPNQGGSTTFMLTSSNVTLDSYTDTRDYTSDPFTAVVSGQFNNYTSDTLAVRFGWGLFQDGTMISRLYSAYNTTLRPGYHHTHTNRALEFGANLTSGTYSIMPMFSEYGQDNWRPCDGADRNYIEVTISGNNCHFTGYGTAGERNYSINDIVLTGNMHNGRPISIDVNMTNNGTSSNELLYMFINGTAASTGYVGLEPGETGNVHYIYLFEDAGQYTITWSFNEDGSDPIASRDITIEAMPAATLTATIKIMDVTDATNKIITSDKFSVELTITNSGTTTYDEDISAKLFKNTKGTSGTSVQGRNQHLILAPGETATMRFEMDNVIDGWKYFIKTYFYSEGTEVSLKGTSTYTIVFPEEDPEVLVGDVNDDKEVSIADVTTLIDYLLGRGSVNERAADVNGDTEISIADVTALIDMLLRGGL